MAHSIMAGCDAAGPGPSSGYYTGAVARTAREAAARLRGAWWGRAARGRPYVARQQRVAPRGERVHQSALISTRRGSVGTRRYWTVNASSSSMTAGEGRVVGGARMMHSVRCSCGCAVGGERQPLLQQPALAALAVVFLIAQFPALAASCTYAEEVGGNGCCFDASADSCPSSCTSESRSTSFGPGGMTFTCTCSSCSSCAATTCDGSATAVATPSNADVTITGSSTAARAAGQACGSTLVFTCAAGTVSSSGGSQVTLICSGSGTFTTHETCVAPCVYSEDAASNGCCPSANSCPSSCSSRSTSCQNGVCSCNCNSCSSNPNPPPPTPTTCDGRTSAVATPSNADATIAGGSTASRAASQPIGSTLVFTCSAGYSGSLTYTCDQNGQFTTSDSACAAVAVTCDGRMSAVATPPNAVATIAGSSTATQAASQPIGSTLVFTCSAGYSANVTYTCDQNGQFTTSDSCAQTLWYVVVSPSTGYVDGQTCTSAGFQAVVSRADCDAAIQSVNAANGKPGSSSSPTTVDYSFRPAGCFASCQSASAGYFCGYWNTDTNSIGSSSSRHVFCRSNRNPANVTCDGRIPAPNNTQVTNSSTAAQAVLQPLSSTLIFTCNSGFMVSPLAPSTITYQCLTSGNFIRISDATACVPNFWYVVVSPLTGYADGQTCTSAGFQPVISGADCDAAIQSVNAADGKPGLSSSPTTVDYSFRPAGCFASCQNTGTGYFCGYWNTDTNSIGSSSSRHVFCRSSTNPTSRDQDKCANSISGKDVSSGERTSSCPNGLGGMSNQTCCAACDADTECETWIFATDGGNGGFNCWLLKNVSSITDGMNRVVGGKLPTCDGGTSTLNEPINTMATIAGSSTATQAASQPIGSTLVFTCSAGYSGSLTYTCDQNGQFTTSDSACAAVAVTCNGRMSAVATPPNAVATIAGSSTATQAASQPIGSTLVFTCSAGYSGSLTYTCDQNGQFTTSDSACAAPPGPPSTSSNCTATGMTVTVPSLAVILTTADVLSLSAEATSTQPCTVGQRSRVLFRWTLAIGTSNGGLPSNFTVTSADLRISRYTLAPGNFTLQVTATENSGVSASAAVKVSVRPLPLFVRIRGGVTRSVAPGTALSLDASDSFDPNANPTQTDPRLSFQWLCQARGLPCPETVLPASTIKTGKMLSLASIPPVNFTLMFIVQVSKVGLSPAFASVNVTLAAAAAPLVTIQQASTLKVNPAQQIRLRGSVAVSSSTLMTWGWSAVDQSTGTNLVLAPHTTASAAHGNVTTDSALSLIATNLVLRSDVLQQGRSYMFTLAAIDTVGASTGLSSVIVSVNDIPAGGGLNVAPSNGTALETSFLLTSTGWVDGDSAQGLRYSFGYEAPGIVAVRYLRQYSQAASLLTVLPQGLAQGSFAYTLWVEIADVFGGVGRASTIVVVRQPTVTIDEGLVSSLLSEASLIAGAGRVSQTVSGVAAALNLDDGSIDQATAMKTRSLLVDAVSVEISNVLASISADTPIQPDQAAQLGSALAEVTEVASQLSGTALDSALSSLGALVAAGETVDYPVEGVSASASNLLSAMETRPVYSSGRRLLTVDVEQAQSRGTFIENVIGRLGNTLVNKKLEGEDKSAIRTPKFVLEVARDKVANLEGQTIGNGLVRVPAGALSHARSSSASSQVVQYNGSGPLFWTPKELDDGSAGLRTSAVLSVSFKQTISAADTGGLGLGVAGTEIAVANLSNPFLITLPVSAPVPPFSNNLAGKTKDEIEAYISNSWNRSALVEEVHALLTSSAGTSAGSRRRLSTYQSQSCTMHLNASNYTLAIVEERAALAKRAADEGVHCPSKPDSCDAPEVEEKALTGCSGVRGGAEDCARWPAACKCLRDQLRNSYKLDSYLCTFFDEQRKEWRQDGELVETKADGSMVCAFSHLTSFSSFVGPPPTFNRMSVKGLFSKEWIMNNPVSAITAFSTLLLSIMTTIQSLRVYKALLAEVSDEQLRREQYEYRTSEFAMKRQLLDKDVSWFFKSAIKLRSEWPLGAFLCGYPGDPYLKSQRLLVLWASILVSMVLSVIFFIMPNPNCYNECPDETYNGGDSSCAEKCDEDCAGNGFLASILSAVVSIPVVGTLNIMFAWLRRPFEGDLAAKQGVIGEQLREGNKDAETGPRPSCCRRIAHGCCQWLDSQLRCLRATFPCLCRKHAKISPYSQGAGSASAPLHVHKMSVSTANMHVEADRERRKHELSIQALWQRFDPDSTGYIEPKHIRTIMEELNAPRPVSDFAVDFVIKTADVNQTRGLIEKDELRLAIPLYLSLQSVQVRVDRLFDKLTTGGEPQISCDQLSHVLASINDGTAPLPSELDWVVDKARDQEGSEITAKTLSRDEVWRAVAIFYPRLHHRLAIAPPPKVTGHPNGPRQTVRLAMDRFVKQLESRFPSAIVTAGQVKSILADMTDDTALSNEDLHFILDLADVASTEVIHKHEIQPALALFLALYGKQQRQLDAELEAMYSTGDVTESNVTECIKRAITHLDDGAAPVESEVEWVVQTARQRADGAIDRAELRRALAVWFPRVMIRRDIAETVKPASAFNAGARRRACALQLAVHQRWVHAGLQVMYKGRGHVGMSRFELHALMQTLSDDDKIDDDEVDFVLHLAEHPAGQAKIVPADIAQPLAMWRGLQSEIDFIRENFDRYDSDGSGLLEREQLSSLLTDINGGKPPRKEEVDWILSHGTRSQDTEGKHELGIDRKDLRVAITLWFHHVANLKIKARAGCRMLIPFVYTLIATIASCAVVAATTVLFSERKTAEWLGTVGMSLLWRNFLIDPLKAVMFGRMFELVFGLLLGGCALEDAAAGVLQDEIEGSGEDLADGTADVAGDLLAADDLLESDAVSGDVVSGDVVSGDVLTAGAAGATEDAEEEEIEQLLA